MRIDLIYNYGERYGMKLLIRNIFLLSCIESMNNCGNECANKCERTDSNVNKIEPMKDLKKKPQAEQLG